MARNQFKALQVAMPNMMHKPVLALVDETANCEALVWINGKRSLVLLVDVGGGATVGNAIDALIPFVVKRHLSRHHLAWQSARFFSCDRKGLFDEIVVDATDDMGACEANWQPLPSPCRTFEGFLKRVAIAGFSLSEADVDVIKASQVRWEQKIRKAA